MYMQIHEHYEQFFNKVSKQINDSMKYGGDLASTWVAKPEVHAEDVVLLVK